MAGSIGFNTNSSYEVKKHFKAEDGKHLFVITLDAAYEIELIFHTAPG